MTNQCPQLGPYFWTLVRIRTFEQTSPDLVRIELLKSGLTIFRAYADDKPYSFGSKHRLYEAYAKDVDNALYKNDTYTSFKQHRCSKSFSPINCNKDLH